MFQWQCWKLPKADRLLSLLCQQREGSGRLHSHVQDNSSPSTATGSRCMPAQPALSCGQTAGPEALEAASCATGCPGLLRLTRCTFCS